MKKIIQFFKKLFRQKQDYSEASYKPMWAKVPIGAMTEPYGAASRGGRKHQVTVLHPKYRPTKAEVTTRGIQALKANGCEVMY